MNALRILLADDHAILRDGLRRLLEEAGPYTVVGEAATGPEAVRAAERLQPQLAILDISMPELNGIEATRHIRRSASRVRVIILSMHLDAAYVLRAVQAGASAYVVKQSAAAEIVQAVQAVAAGYSFLSPAIAGVMFDESGRTLLARGLHDRYDILSGREREVLQLVAEGHTTKEIADRLSVSVPTIETHRANLLRKLAVRNTAGLVLFAARHGLVD